MAMGKLSIQMEQLKKVILKIISILDLSLEVNTSSNCSNKKKIKLNSQED